MTRSMTGYGRASVTGLYVIELHSVNRKGLEFSMQIPRELLSLDVPFRKKLSSSLERGHVTCRLTACKEEGGHNLSQLKSAKTEWDSISAELGYSSSDVTLPFLLDQLQTKPAELSSGQKDELLLALDSALTALCQMKEIEGKALSEDIQKRLHVIEELLPLVLEGASSLVTSYGKKISDRLEEIGFLDEDLKSRAAKEIALLVEKMDITEEEVRVRAHLKRFDDLLSSSALSVGRTLEFLCQEMLREINTMGSKVQGEVVSPHVISMKAELDRIREQVQNIE